MAHIFKGEEGHLPDTPENRQLLRDVADDPKSALGIDTFSKQLSARMLEDGRQVWTATRNGLIRNCGVNDIPITFDQQTELSSPTKPLQK